MITRLDQYVGEIFAKLKEKGLDRNTVVIFTSDNGPHEEGATKAASAYHLSPGGLSISRQER
ncbi:Sulfatase [Segatella copri]|nr:Sulfatase [Segatella copri]